MTVFPPLLTDFLLTIGMSFLLGLALREYYQANQKRVVFGTTRTCMFIGLLGFALFEIQQDGWLYLAGFLILGAWLAQFYRYKIGQQETGLIGLLLASMSYTLGPVSLNLPHWFLILYVIAALFILNAKEKIRILTLTLASQEIITLAKFLVLSGVILPLTPREPIADFLPVSLHQTWLAVVVISGISYLAYLVQAYFLKGRGILLTGAMGGLYSSTATTVVIARQSHHYPPGSSRPVVATLLATAVMYLRLLAIVSIFRPSLGWSALPGFVGLAALAGLLALSIHRRNHEPGGLPPDAGLSGNPLEINTALFFALSFLAVTGITHLILLHYPVQGLAWMALAAGFTDIDPFVLALVQGSFSATGPELGRAVFLAAASNNLLKAVYVWMLGARTMRPLAAGSLAVMSAATLGVALWGL